MPITSHSQQEQGQHLPSGITRVIRKNTYLSKSRAVLGNVTWLLAVVTNKWRPVVTPAPGSSRRIRRWLWAVPSTMSRLTAVIAQLSLRCSLWLRAISGKMSLLVAVVAHSPVSRAVVLLRINVRASKTLHGDGSDNPEQDVRPFRNCSKSQGEVARVHISKKKFKILYCGLRAVTRQVAGLIACETHTIIRIGGLRSIRACTSHVTRLATSEKDLLVFE